MCKWTLSIPPSSGSVSSLWTVGSRLQDAKQKHVSVCQGSFEEAMQLLPLPWQSSDASQRLLLGLFTIPQAIDGGQLNFVQDVTYF